jgi:large subunit ribosomal protein L23
MKDERLMNILLSPVISEKSASGSDVSRHYAFKVLPDADKQEIGLAVEKMFDVRVESVRVLNVKGKRKRFGSKGLGKRKDWRKAYVRLQTGYEIEFGTA